MQFFLTEKAEMPLSCSIRDGLPHFSIASDAELIRRSGVPEKIARELGGTMSSSAVAHRKYEEVYFEGLRYR